MANDVQSVFIKLGQTSLDAFKGTTLMELGLQLGKGLRMNSAVGITSGNGRWDTVTLGSGTVATGLNQADHIARTIVGGSAWQEIPGTRTVLSAKTKQLLRSNKRRKQWMKI